MHNPLFGCACFPTMPVSTSRHRFSMEWNYIATCVCAVMQTKVCMAAHTRETYMDACPQVGTHIHPWGHACVYKLIFHGCMSKVLYIVCLMYFVLLEMLGYTLYSQCEKCITEHLRSSKEVCTYTSIFNLKLTCINVGFMLRFTARTVTYDTYVCHHKVSICMGGGQSKATIKNSKKYYFHIKLHGMDLTYKGSKFHNFPYEPD